MRCRSMCIWPQGIPEYPGVTTVERFLLRLLARVATKSSGAERRMSWLSM